MKMSYERDKGMSRGLSAYGVRLTVLSAFLLLSAAATGAQSQSGPSLSSIRVHGHWVIEVRESDGRIVGRHEFDNALEDQRALLAVFGRVNSVGHWYVGLGDLYGDGEPCVSGTPAVPTSCTLQEPGDARVYSSGTRLSVLSVALEGTPSPNQLVLQGTFTAQNTGQISSVVTGLGVCASTVAPSAPCTDGLAFSVTRHVFAQTGAPGIGPIPVNAGQIVQVRVAISFSPV